MPYGAHATAATCANCGGWRFHFKIPEDGKCKCGARFPQQDIALAKMLRAAMGDKQYETKGRGKGGGDASTWPWRAPATGDQRGGKNAAKGDRSKGGGKGNAKGQGRLGKGDGKGGNGATTSAHASAASEDETSEVAAGSGIGSSASVAQLSPALCLGYLQNYAKENGVQTDALQTLAEQLPSKEQEDAAKEKSEENQPETAARSFALAKKAWFKDSDAHVKMGKKVVQGQKEVSELEAKLSEARKALEETRAEFKKAASKVDAALAHLLVKQREAAAEKQQELENAGEEHDEFTSETGWDKVGKNGKKIKQPKKPEQSAAEKQAWESFQAMLVERAKLVVPVPPGGAVPSNGGAASAEHQEVLRRALEEALAKCDAAAAADKANCRAGASGAASAVPKSDADKMEDVPPRRKRDAAEPTEALEDEAANDEELQRIKKLHEERRLQFENNGHAEEDLFHFPAYMADDDQHL